MRRFWLSVAACVAASWAWAAPNPAHVPAGAAAVVVADRLDGAPSVEALLAAARREVGEDPVPFSPMRWVNPTRRWVEAVRRTVLFPEGGKVGARSFVLALCVPRAQKRDFADGIDAVAFAEGEAIDLGGLTREAEAMVVSETGARLSPKRPPETTAPMRNRGSAPTRMPSGKRRGIETTYVPTEVPVDMDSRQHKRKLTAQKAAPDTRAFTRRKARESMRPLAATSLPSTAANRIATATVPNIGRANPAMAASPYALRSLANRQPAATAAKKATL